MVFFCLCKDQKENILESKITRGGSLRRKAVLQESQLNGVSKKTQQLFFWLDGCHLFVDDFVFLCLVLGG
jgi:hypothetical protein